MTKRINLKFKKKKAKSIRKKDEENILSRDIDIEIEMKDIEKINETKTIDYREIRMNTSRNQLKNLKFLPTKYKGNFLPYHLRWVMSNTSV